MDDTVKFLKMTQNTLEVISGVAKATTFLNDSIKLNSVYVSYKNDALEYVGITNDFNRRKNEWKYIRDIQEEIPGLSRSTARCSEQLVISLFGKGGTPNLSNIRNSIGIHGRLVDDYIDFFRKFF